MKIPFDIANARLGLYSSQIPLANSVAYGLSRSTDIWERAFYASFGALFLIGDIVVERCVFRPIDEYNKTRS